MSSTPIYDELAATYLADLIPEPAEPAADEPSGQASPATAPPPSRPQPRARPQV